MREAENIKEIESLDIDLMGFIFYEKSSRNVSAKPSYLPKKISRVGVFVDAEVQEIISKVKAFELNYIQLHGKESKEFCQKLFEILSSFEKKVGIIKAISVAEEKDLSLTQSFEPFIDYFLFDTPTLSRGGSGKHFNWEVLKAYKGKTPFLLSGGIGPGDISLLQSFHHESLAGIDLNSRFETSPGVKNKELLSDFISQARLNLKRQVK